MSTSESGRAVGSVTLDQFIALNDELAALVRAGVPLERGLIDAGRDLRGRLGVVANDLGHRMGEGMPLSEAVAASGSGMPDLYRAVVEAGVRSGRLSRALEGMAAIAKGYAEARRAVGMALIYPLILLCLAYALGLFFLIVIAPRLVSAFRALGIEPVRGLGFLEWLGATSIYWGAIPPLLLILAAIRWAWMGRSMVLDRDGFGPLLNKFPVIGTMMASFRAANLAGLLALLIEHRVPLDEAVRLAGDASGHRKLRASAARLADSIRSGGGSVEAPSRDRDAFPPLLSWMLTAGHRQGDLAVALAHLAKTYRGKAKFHADFLQLALPSLCMLTIGVGAVFTYAMILFIPLSNLWNELTLPVNR